MLDDINLPRKELKKGEDALINALYVCILDILKLKLTAADLKYPTIDDFLKVYGEEFKYESENEKYLLWETANWMQVLFKITTARKNTGLTIQVVPKVVEGWKGESQLCYNQQQIEIILVPIYICLNGYHHSQVHNRQRYEEVHCQQNGPVPQRRRSQSYPPPEATP